MNEYSKSGRRPNRNKDFGVAGELLYVAHHDQNLREEEGVIYLGVPNEFTREWLTKKCHNSILRILRS